MSEKKEDFHFKIPKRYSVFDEDDFDIYDSFPEEWKKLSHDSGDKPEFAAYKLYSVVQKLENGKSPLPSADGPFIALLHRLFKSPPKSGAEEKENLASLERIVKKEKERAYDIRHLDAQDLAVHDYFVHSLVCNWALWSYMMMTAVAERKGSNLIEYIRYRGSLTRSLLLLNLGETAAPFNTHWPNAALAKGMRQVREKDDDFMSQLFTELIRGLDIRRERAPVPDSVALVRTLSPGFFDQAEICRFFDYCHSLRMIDGKSQEHDLKRKRLENFVTLLLYIFASGDELRNVFNGLKQPLPSKSKGKSKDSNPLLESWIDSARLFNSPTRRDKIDSYPLGDYNAIKAEADYDRLPSGFVKHVQTVYLPKPDWQMSLWMNEEGLLNAFTAQKVILCILGMQEHQKERSKFQSFMDERDMWMQIRSSLGFCAKNALNDMKDQDKQVFSVYYPSEEPEAAASQKASGSPFSKLSNAIRRSGPSK